MYVTANKLVRTAVADFLQTKHGMIAEDLLQRHIRYLSFGPIEKILCCL